MQSRWFDFGGDTIVRADQYARPFRPCCALRADVPFTYRYIRLTSDRPSQSGWLFSKLPLTATNWEVHTNCSSIPSVLPLANAYTRLRWSSRFMARETSMVMGLRCGSQSNERHPDLCLAIRIYLKDLAYSSIPTRTTGQEWCFHM